MPKKRGGRPSGGPRPRADKVYQPSILQDMYVMGWYGMIGLLGLTVVRWGYWLLASVVGFFWPATILGWVWGGISAVLFDAGNREPFAPSWIAIALVYGGAFGVSKALTAKN